MVDWLLSNQTVEPRTRSVDLSGMRQDAKPERVL